MLQEWHYYFQNTLRWRNLRKITIAQVQGTVYAAGLMLMWACDLIVAADERLLRRRGRHPARHVRGRVLRPPVGVRPPPDQGAHAHRRRHRRPRGAPAGHGAQDLPDRRAGRADAGLRPAHRRAADGDRPADQGVGQPDRRQHGLLQLPAGLLHPAPAQPLPLGRGPREQVPGGRARGRHRRLAERAAGALGRARRGGGTARWRPGEGARHVHRRLRGIGARPGGGGDGRLGSAASPIAELDERSIRFARVLAEFGLRRGRPLRRAAWRTTPRTTRSCGPGCGRASTSPRSTRTSLPGEAAYIVDDCQAQGAGDQRGHSPSWPTGDGRADPGRRAPGGMVEGDAARAPRLRRAVVAAQPAGPLEDQRAGHGHALLLGDDGPPQGGQVPPAPGRLAPGGMGDRRAQPGPLRFQRGHGVPEPGPPLPRRPPAGDPGRAERGRDGGGDGALRSRPRRWR